MAACRVILSRSRARAARDVLRACRPRTRAVRLSGMSVTSIAIISACVLLLLVGALAAARWGNVDLQRPWLTVPEGGADDLASPTPSGAPPVGAPPSAAAIVRRAAWYMDLVMLAGMGAGIMGSGPGGRLVMRLLAVTSSESAQGQLTEAGEVVGAVTLDGTFGLVIFGGVFSGVATAALWLLLRRWLPTGRAGALTFGLVLLALVSTRLEPLRPDNEDFELVGPAGVAVASFVALTFFHTAVLVALVGRISRSLPLCSFRPRVLAAYSPLVLLALTGSGAVVFVVVTLGAMLALRSPALARSWSGRRCLVGGRVVLVALTALAVPSFVGDLADILG